MLAVSSHRKDAFTEWVMNGVGVEEPLKIAWFGPFHGEGNACLCAPAPPFPLLSLWQLTKSLWIAGLPQRNLFSSSVLMIHFLVSILGKSSLYFVKIQVFFLTFLHVGETDL